MKFPWWNQPFEPSPRVRAWQSVMATDPTYEQFGFRFRNDDGDEEASGAVGFCGVGCTAGATAIAGCNADITRGTGTGNRFRVIIGWWNDNNRGGSAIGPQLEYDKNALDVWNDVDGSTSSNIRGTSGTPTDGAAIDCYPFAGSTGCNSCSVIDQPAGAGGKDTGEYSEDGRAANHTFTKDFAIAWEFCLYLIDADVANNDTIDLRVRDAQGNGYTITYTEVPRVTVSKPGVGAVKDVIGSGVVPFAR